MGFMDAYKRLDNLCKTFPDYPKGISSYLEVMESATNGRYHCAQWCSAYAQLKRLRYIRNQISHANGASEENMCTPEDEEWIRQFHASLIDQTDPLGQYYRSMRAPVINTRKSAPIESPVSEQPREPMGCGAMSALIAVPFVLIGCIVTCLIMILCQ